MTVLLLAVAVPGLLAIAWLGGRRVQSTPLARSLALARGADTRGIALQTVIIIVVLLAIAGAVAASTALQREPKSPPELASSLMSPLPVSRLRRSVRASRYGRPGAR